MSKKSQEDGQRSLPKKQGLYDPRFEHDACGMGMVANIRGEKSNSIIRQALTILKNLTHRGARGAEPNTGDGAGIMIQVPHVFLSRKAERHSFSLPDPGYYGVGIVFLPTDMKHRRAIEIHFEKIIASEGQRLIGWRTVKVNNEALGKTAKLAEPKMRMVFIARGAHIPDEMAFERKLYVIRKRAENEIRHGGRFEDGDYFYIPSLSYKTLVYKGMLVSDQLEDYFLDLREPDVESALAIVHSRFSTNTFPSWERAHPYRYVSHNGEINTLRGNVNWVRAQEAMFESELFGGDMKKLLPIIHLDGSDTAMFDNFLEFLTLSGRPLHHAMAMMIPEPWANDENMDDAKRAFYEFHANLMEPWDGPAAMGFSDGVVAGAMLDRNGLRPARYYITTDDRLLLASEVGVLDIPTENIKLKGRLSPGKMLLVDTQQGRVIHDEEIKSSLANEHPYRDWLNKYQVRLEDLPEPRAEHLAPTDLSTLIQRQKAFGYTTEDLNFILMTMASDGVEPIGSMGNDAALAVLSTRPRLLYDYFRQLFAQVTNPPIDSIREALVISTEVMVGAESNLLRPTPQSCHQIRLDTPILTNEEFAKISYGKIAGFASITFPILFAAGSDGQGMESALEDLYLQADAAIARGFNLIILTDRGMDETHAPIPALLAVSGLHHHLIQQGTRTQVGILLESGEPREVHHFAALIGYGATAINPYLVFESLEGLIQDGILQETDTDHAIKNFVKASVKGVVKVLSKMGISAIQSYCGAQIFEALGIHQAVIDKYFTHTPSRLSGINLDVIATEAEMRHREGFSTRSAELTLPPGGQYKWRKDSERHAFNPQSIYFLQSACRTNNYDLYKKYASTISDDLEEPATLRVLFDLRLAQTPVPIEEVESVESIVRRFKSGAMSYGSISQEAHEALAIAMNRIGGRSNSGEGGEDPARYPKLPNGDWKRSAIKQVASARFGVTSEYLVNAGELQIKMAQGAKPGEGGQLPGRKVYPWIARTRHSTPGVGLISPPPHHDIYSIEDLAELIYDLKNANREARITVKLVSEVGVGTIAAGVAKGHADVVLISGHDGGTGASPVSSIKHAGLPWELGLAETHQTLILNGLRDRIAIEVDGQLKTGRDVVIAALLGAEEFGFATAPLVALGCVMMRVCHLDTCPEGVATQNPELRRNFKGDPQHVVNLMYFIAQDMREWMAKLGFRTVQEMVGRSDKLQARKVVEHWKARHLDFSEILYQMGDDPEFGASCRVKQEHGLESTLDSRVLLDLCRPATQSGKLVDATLPIRNINRVVGTSVGSEITRKYGAEGLPSDTIRLYFQGSAGQSFGAFIPKGMTMALEGDANDYIGKGLSGGRIAVYPPDGSTFAAEENVIIGNVAFYGATGGEAFINGVAGERFCVRNSGANAVVEGVGDHGCEYMTGGRVVVLGKTGRNFAAGMSGGIAYVLDTQGDFPRRCNLEMVSLGSIEDSQEAEQVRELIRRHFEYTNSPLARRVLANWDSLLPKFVRVMPQDYERALDALREVEASGLTGDEAIMAAFERNKNDLARVSGN